jgi:hypothetical protein
VAVSGETDGGDQRWPTIESRLATVGWRAERALPDAIGELLDYFVAREVP